MLPPSPPPSGPAFVPAPAPGWAARPLIVTADPHLLDDLLRLAAAAGVDAEVVHDAGAARQRWLTAPLAVVGSDLADEVVRLGLGRREDIVLIGLDRESVHVWEQAVAVGAEQVLFLPDAEPWLVNRLADAGEPPGPEGVVVSVLGGRGGAGATTLATALALTGARTGRRTTLVDGDPLGGGIDLVLGGEDEVGMRWPELAGTHGRLSVQALQSRLPEVEGLTVLSWDRGDRLSTPPAAMESVLRAARRGGDLVVVDVPRCLDATSEAALSRCDIALLIVPAEVRATAAAGRVAAAAGRMTADLRLVVRGPAPSRLPARVVAEALGLPLAGVMKAEPGLAEALERGEPPGRRGRGPLAEFCRGFLSTVSSSRQVAA